MRQSEKDEPLVLAVDLGGTKIATAIITGSGQIIAGEQCPTLADEGAQSVIDRLLSAIDQMLKRNDVNASRLDGIGIACAGGIDSERGIVVTPSPNLPGWTDMPLGDIVRERFKIDTFLVNDASAAALGEQQFGAGRGVDNLVLVTVGTGIGGGIITNGELYLGACGSAGEIGHMTIDASGPGCGCGNTGCLEMLASGTAIAREAIRRISGGEKTSLAGDMKGSIEEITARDVEAAARGGDALALDVISTGATWLGIGIVNLVNIFNPQMVVIGGGMAKWGGLLIDPVKRIVKERAFPISAQAVSIVTTELGGEAGLYGAASFALSQQVARLQ